MSKHIQDRMLAKAAALAGVPGPVERPRQVGISPEMVLNMVAVGILTKHQGYNMLFCGFVPTGFEVDVDLSVIEPQPPAVTDAPPEEPEITETRESEDERTARIEREIVERRRSTVNAGPSTPETDDENNPCPF